MRYLVVSAMLLFVPAMALPCSCLGIATIDESIQAEPFLVEGRVVALEEYDLKQYGHQVHSATLEVRKVLKGSVASKTIVVENSMCYASLYLEHMKVKNTYVLPLSATESGRYRLAGCAHSGLELLDGKLYTFEQTEGSGRRVQFYANYSDFVQRFDIARMAPNTSLERTRER